MKRFKNIVKRVKGNPLLSAIVVWFTFMWSWVLFTDTLDLAGNETQGLILAIIILAFNVILSSAILWQGFRVAKWLVNKYPTWGGAILTLPLFALTDWLVAWISSILWIGPQGRIDSILPLATPSLVLINSPLSFAARIVGFFGLAGFFWATIALLRTEKTRRLASIPLILLGVLSLVGWLSYKTPNGVEVSATVISENLNDHVPVEDNNDSRLIIFPEYGLDEINNNNLDERIARTSDAEQKVYFLGSQQLVPDRPGDIGHLNTMLYGNSTDGITMTQDKYRLIPGGEDLPYLLRIGLRATNQKATLDYFSYAKGVIKGPHQLQPLTAGNGVVVGAAVCSSIISPQDYREFTQNGATILSNSASLTIFKGSPLFSWQQKSFAKFMAVANSRPFLQSANAARAYALDNNGNTLAEVTGTQTATVTVKSNTTKTLYTILGEWMPAIGSLIASLLLVKHLAAKRNKR